MTMTARTRTDEINGIRICDAPQCHRQLKPDHGQITPTHTGSVRTCFGVACLAWALDQAMIS